MRARSDDLLFSALTGELRLPLLQIARLSELGTISRKEKIHLISSQALQLVDAYAQAQTQTGLALEPISSHAVLYDVATVLEPYAKQADVVLELDYQGRLQPVMGHKESLTTMMMLLGMSLIDAAVEDDVMAKHVVLGTHRSAKGTVVGAFSTYAPINQQVLDTVRALYGRANQAVPHLGQSAGAGLAIADRLSQQMHAPLKTYRHRTLTGIGSLLTPTRQLNFVV
jgi:hypothetical protein